MLVTFLVKKYLFHTPRLNFQMPKMAYFIMYVRSTEWISWFCTEAPVWSTMHCNYL